MQQIINSLSRSCSAVHRCLVAFSLCLGLARGRGEDKPIGATMSVLITWVLAFRNHYSFVPSQPNVVAHCDTDFRASQFNCATYLWRGNCYLFFIKKLLLVSLIYKGKKDILLAISWVLLVFCGAQPLTPHLLPSSSPPLARLHLHQIRPIK